MVLDLTCALSPREAWRLVAAATDATTLTSPLDTAFAAARGDTGLTATPWTVHHPGRGGGGGASTSASPAHPATTTIRTRSVRYTTPLKRTWLGPSSAACDAVWACGARGEAGWAITQTVHTPGVPFGDCFHTAVLVVAADVSGMEESAAAPGPAPPLLPPARSSRRSRITSMVASSSSVAAAAAAAPASHPPVKGSSSRPGSAASPSPSPAKKGRDVPRLTRITVSGSAVFTAPIALPGVRALIAKSTADGLRESYRLYGGLLAQAAVEVQAEGRRGRKGGKKRAGSGEEPGLGASPGGGGGGGDTGLLAQQPQPAAAATAAALAVAVAVAVSVAAAVAVAATSSPSPAHAGWFEAAGEAAAAAAAAFGKWVG